MLKRGTSRRSGASHPDATVEDNPFSLLPDVTAFQIARDGGEPGAAPEGQGTGTDQAQSYLYLTWSQEEKKYIKDSMDPLDHVDAVRMLNLMIQLSSFPDTVGRFHALRPLSAEHRSEVLPFLLEIQSRTPEANQLYLQLRRLCRNGALHLIGATMRPSKIGRSPLALQVDRLLQSL